MAILTYLKPLGQILHNAIKTLLLGIYTMTAIATQTQALPTHYTTKLDNGLLVVAIPMENDSNVVSTNVYYNVGSGDEIMGKSGIAHMLEHMNFKSTKNLSEGEFDKIVKEFGGVNNASTGFDYTKYYIKSSSKNMGKSMELFAELMQNLQLTDEEFQKERNVVAEERRWRTENSPMGYLYFKLFNALFDYQSYHWTPIGFMQDIQSWNIKDIQDFHSKFYTPSNAVLVIAGDVSKEQVFEDAKKHFASIKDSAVVEPPHMMEEMQKVQKDILLEKETQVQMLAIAFRGVKYDDKDQLALDLLGNILSNGKTSRLYETMVIQKKLVNKIYAYNMDLKYSGAFIVMAVCNPDIEASEVKKEILALLEEVKKEGVTQKELTKIKKNIKTDIVFSFTDSMSVSDLFGSYYSKGNIKPLMEYESDLEKVTKTDIKKVSQEYLNYPVSVILKNKI